MASVSFRIWGRIPFWSQWSKMAGVTGGWVEASEEDHPICISVQLYIGDAIGGVIAVLFFPDIAKMPVSVSEHLHQTNGFAKWAFSTSSSILCKFVIRVVGNWVKFHILIYSGHLQKYSLKEVSLTCWISNKKPCQQQHRLIIRISSRVLRDSMTCYVGRSVGLSVGRSVSPC